MMKMIVEMMMKMMVDKVDSQMMKAGKEKTLFIFFASKKKDEGVSKISCSLSLE